MAEGVKKTFKKMYRINLAKALELICNLSDVKKNVKELVARIERLYNLVPTIENYRKYFEAELHELINEFGVKPEDARKCQNFTHKESVAETDRATYQAMEALIHNLNTMHSRAGAQVPFSSINYGMDTSVEGRMVIKNLLLSTESGLGNNETPIFPIQIFRIKEGVNYNPEDPNYDLYKLSLRVTAKRLFPNYSFLDAPFNLAYYKGNPETEIAYMGCVDYNETIILDGLIKCKVPKKIGNIYDQLDYLYNHKSDIKQMLAEMEEN